MGAEFLGRGSALSPRCDPAPRGPDQAWSSYVWVGDALTGTLFQGCVGACGTRHSRVSPPQTSCFRPTTPWAAGGHRGSGLMVTSVGGGLG